MFEKAWPYGYAIRILAMEGTGVLKSLHAANQQIKQHSTLITLAAFTSEFLPIVNQSSYILQELGAGYGDRRLRLRFGPWPGWVCAW